MSDACFNRSHLEATTGIRLEARMDNHHLEAPDFMDRAFFIFFIAQLLPLIVALGLHRYKSASFTALELFAGTAADKEAAGLVGATAGPPWPARSTRRSPGTRPSRVMVLWRLRRESSPTLPARSGSRLLGPCSASFRSACALTGRLQTISSLEEI